MTHRRALGIFAGLLTFAALSGGACSLCQSEDE